MISTYEEFKDHIIAMVKVRSANYAETDCDIEAIMYAVYEDIQNTVLLEVVKQEHEVTEDIEFEIRSNNAPLEYDMYGNPHYDDSKATETYTDVLEIVDWNDVSILDYLHQTDTDKWRWNVYYDCKSNCVPKSAIGKNIYFYRKKITGLQHMNQKLYSRIMSAMLEGIMYYIQSAIPSATDTGVANYSYQRFYNAKKALMNQSPQHIIAMKRRPQWL
jgi:hypothetical protein